MGAMSLPLAAQVKVTVSASKQPVGTVLEQIKQSSGYEIFYNDDHVKNLKPVTIKANNEDIKKVLNKVFAGTGISYTIRDKQVIITTKDKGKSTTDEKPAKKKDEPKKSTSPRTVTGTVTEPTVSHSSVPPCVKRAPTMPPSPTSTVSFH